MKLNNEDDIPKEEEFSNNSRNSSYFNDYYPKKIQYNIYKSIKNTLKINIKSQNEEILAIEKEIKNDLKKNIIEYKILVTGEHLTGKTSFCSRFALNEFNLEVKSYSQTECYLKTIMLFDKEIKIYLVDTDSNNIKTFMREFFNEISGIIVLYDVTKLKSFEATEKLIKELRDNVGNVIPFLLVGNKNDLKYLRSVDYEEANEKAKLLKCEIKETNCVDEESVRNIVKYLISKIYYNDLDDIEKDKLKNLMINQKGQNP